MCTVIVLEVKGCRVFGGNNKYMYNVCACLVHLSRSGLKLGLGLGLGLGLSR